METHELKDYGTNEYLHYHVTINSNRNYYSMPDGTKAAFSMFVNRIFLEELQNYLVYRQWGKLKGKNYIKRGDEDPALQPPVGAIKYLEPSVSYEIGGIYSKLHAHVFIQIKATKFNDWTIDLFHNIIRLEFEQEFGQKCHLSFGRQIDESLKIKLYAMKNAKTAPIQHESKVLISNLG